MPTALSQLEWGVRGEGTKKQWERQRPRNTSLTESQKTKRSYTPKGKG